MPEHNLLDISNYQEQPGLKRFIDWRVLKDDPLNFEGIWIKSSEGESVDFYPVADFKRQVAGARSVGFLSVQPYHFYYYHVPMDIDADGELEWYILNPTLMAQAFFKSCDGFTFSHPMVDLEDPYIMRFLTYSDTASANAAIAFASKVMAHIHKYLLEVERLFGARPDIYSADWWWSPIARLLLDNGRASELAWVSNYKWIVANYTLGGPIVPAGVRRDHIIAWQRTSTPKPYVKGIPTGMIAPGSNLDIDQWVGSEQQWLDYTGTNVIEVPMTGTYKTTVPMSERGRLTWFSDEDKKVDIAGVCAASDAVFLAMVSQATGTMLVKKDAAFPTWVDRLSVPGLGVVTLDANLFWNKEIDKDKFTARTMWVNETIRAIIDQWRSVAIPYYQWDAKKLEINSATGWHKLAGLVLLMTSTTYVKTGTGVNGMWQTALIDDITKVLRTLMDGGYIPLVPIYLAASWDFYKTYDGDETFKPELMIASGQLAGMGITRVWGKPQAGLMAEVPMGTPLETLSEAWAFVPGNDFAYPYSPKAANMQFFVYSFGRILAKSAFYAGASLSPITSAVWCDTASEMGKSLGATITPPPVVIPPVPIPELVTLQAQVTSIQTKLELLYSTLVDGLK